MLKGGAEPGKNGEDSTPRQTQGSVQDKNQEESRMWAHMGPVLTLSTVSRIILAWLSPRV